MLDALSLGALFLVSLALTLILWKAGLLKIYSSGPIVIAYQREVDRETQERLSHVLHGGQEPARFKIDKIFEAEIPVWMAKPPISYTICFLIVAVAVSVIMLALASLLRILK